jgi:hypothetical protein
MVRIGISVEGVTEEHFVKRLLEPYFSERGIYLTPVNLGGNVSVDRVKGELERLLYSFDYVTTYFDFYGFKRKVEGETKESLEARIASSVKEDLRERLIPYVQMYEFEGLLFSAPDIMAAVLHEDKLRQWAISVLADFGNDPEKINDSPMTSPSKRLLAEARYLKTTHGPDILAQAGLELLRERCRGFHHWLMRLETLRRM